MPATAQLLPVYTDSYFEQAKLRRNMHNVTTHCMLSAGLRLRKKKINGKQCCLLGYSPGTLTY